MSVTQNRRLIPATNAAWRLALRAVRQPTILRDDYLDWLLLVNAGMQHPGNLLLFDLAVRTAPDAPMLEIGSFCGLSVNIVQYLKRKHNRTSPLFSCDKWIFEGAETPLPSAALVSHADIRDYVMQSFVRSVRRFNGEDLPFTIEATSDEFFQQWSGNAEVQDVFARDVSLGGPLGFCFVDGNHSEEYALRSSLKMKVLVGCSQK